MLELSLSRHPRSSCTAAAALLLSMLLSVQLSTVSAAKCRRITVFTADGGSCPRGFENSVGGIAACVNRCSDIPTYTAEGTACRECTTSCGVGFCASSSGECIAVVGGTLSDKGSTALGLDECPDPRNGNWPETTADTSVRRCGDIADISGVQANGQLNPRADADQANYWKWLKCSDRICGAWKEVYGVEPGQTWGNMPEGYKKAWDALGCNQKWVAYRGWRQRLQASGL